MPIDQVMGSRPYVLNRCLQKGTSQRGIGIALWQEILVSRLINEGLRCCAAQVW